MKHFLLILTLFVSSTLFAQQSDTAFLLRKVIDTPYYSYHAIYKDSGQATINRIANFSFHDFDSLAYSESIDRYRFKRIVNLVDHLPKKWIPLYILKGEYYLYDPCDRAYHTLFKITDSTTIDWSMEGPLGSKLNSVRLLNSTQFLLTRTTYQKQNFVNIQLIDTAGGIGVFNFYSDKKSEEKNYRLFVDASKAWMYPAVVNWCPTDKFSEFQFDEINFEALLQKQNKVVH